MPIASKGVSRVNNELVSYLSRYMPITDELADVLARSSFVQTYRKGAVLLREGDRASKGYFILKGCIRSYVLNESVLPIGLGKDVLSTHFLECLEDTVTVESSPDQEARTLAEYPQLKAVCLAMSEIMAEKLQENLARYRTSTPEERYKDLVERRPDLLQRIPQYQIASYLGVKPESLSRIRRRLFNPAGSKPIPDRS
jgi:CRP-like cAMP-binding protein